MINYGEQEILLILTSNTITFLTSPNFSHSAFISLRKSVIKTGFFCKENFIKLHEKFTKQCQYKTEANATIEVTVKKQTIVS